MASRLKKVFKELLPPIFVRIAKRLISNCPNNTYDLTGNYASWAEAVAASTGYDNDDILEKTRLALLKVKNGEAIYERDSVLFEETQYAWPLLAGLMWVAARSGGALNVLDFGGSLGTSYFQNRAFLSLLPEVSWNIVEQPRHVEVGKTWFADEHLHFYTSIADCLAHAQPKVVLLSSVLQYLEHPYVILEQILTLPIDHIIIDRTPFWAGSTDRLCVQTVPPSIYSASYPIWIFSRQLFQSCLEKDWHRIVTFDSLDNLKGPVDFSYQGAILVRRSHPS